MRTVGEIEDYIQGLFNDTSAKTQTALRISVNTNTKDVRRQLKLPFQLNNSAITTVAAQQAYDLPMDYRMLVDLNVTIDSVLYFPRPIASRDQWNDINSGVSADSTSDIPVFYFIDPAADGFEIELYPIPSSSGNTITLNYQGLARDLSDADFTDKVAGTITVANGSADVVGAATAFAATDVGKYIRFDLDGFWYRITAVADANNLTIHRNFEGISIAGGNYRLGTNLNLPDEAMKIIARFTLQELWEKREDMSIAGGKASYYEDRANKALKRLRIDMQEGYDSPDVLALDREDLPLNPNNFPLNIGA